MHQPGQLKIVLQENQLGKPYTVKEVLNGGLMKEKKVIGKTGDVRLKQRMLNYVIEKIQRIDAKIRLSKGE